jgi:DNA-binding NarL/FixJ family response regulator
VTPPLKVIVADDNFLVREGVCRLLADGGDIEVLAQVATASELMSKVRELRPDAVLTDIRMPPRHSMEGIEAALAIRRELPGTGVAVLSQHADASYAKALFRDGTRGLAYLLKERVGDRDQLVGALRAAAAGESFVDPQVVDALVSSEQRARTTMLHSLTERELDVLRSMARGHTNPVIARELHVSESAVSKHISAIFEKLGLVDATTVDRRVSAVLAYVTQHQD